MKRLTQKIDNKVSLTNELNGEMFQEVIDKLAKYEDIEEKELNKEERKFEISYYSLILTILLNKIVDLTQKDTDFDVKIVLYAYAEEKSLKCEYDGLFWENEGNTWKYNNDMTVVKLVDTFFICYRKLFYPKLPHINPSIYLGDDMWEKAPYETRWEYLLQELKSN